GEAVDLERLLVGQVAELTDVSDRRDHQMAGGVRELVQQHERLLAAMDDEGLLVVAVGREAEDAPFLLVGLLDVFEAPRRPERLRHGVLLADLDGRQRKVLGGAVGGRLFLISLLAAVLVLGVGQAGASPVTFADPAGDAGNAPDLTSTVVDNDTAGKISMVISWANAAYLNEDSFISVYFNSDRNAATGNGGSDYLLRIRGSDYTYEY